jgi:hypothetical protein
MAKNKVSNELKLELNDAVADNIASGMTRSDAEMAAVESKIAEAIGTLDKVRNRLEARGHNVATVEIPTERAKPKPAEKPVVEKPPEIKRPQKAEPTPEPVKAVVPVAAPKESAATQRFKSEVAINRVAAERGVVTSKVIDGNGYYDPLTESKYFPEDAAVAPESLANEPKVKPKNNKWKKEKIEVTLDDGSKEKVSAGAMIENLKKMADSLQKLKACLG